MGDYFSVEGYIMLDNENFPLSLLHFCNLFCNQISHPNEVAICEIPRKLIKCFFCVRYIFLLFTDWNSASMSFKSIFLATSIKVD